MHSVAVVVGPCDRVSERSPPLCDVGGPSGHRMTRDRLGRNGQSRGRGDRSGSGERRVDGVEREKRQALADPF